ncbi:MAG: Multidrug resistance protein MdtE precursor [Pseudomonadota bacterium]
MASKNTITAVAVVGIAIAAAGGWWYQNKPASSAVVAAPTAGAPAAGAPGPAAGGAPAGPPRAMGVEVAKVETSPLRDDAQTVGTLKSRQNIMLRPEVAGRVVALGFADGSQVRKGQMLVQLDDSLQRAEIQQAQAQMSIVQANHKRNQDLVSQGFIAQRSLDESQASLQVAQAQVALTCARWERMRIVAPFSGTVGLRTINIGDYVKDGADMVNLEDLTQLYVDFRLPERYQSKLSAKQTVEVLIDAMPGINYQARIEAIDPLLDANGRSISVRAMLRNDGASDTPGKKGAPALKPLEPAVATPNPAPPDTACQPKPAIIADKFTPPGPLRPGMFARVNALFAIKNEALSIPEEAIVPMGEKQFVIRAVAPEAVAGAGPLPPDTKLVSLRTEVKLGTRLPGRVEILSGLSAEDTVVVAGQHRLQKDGTALRVTESRN